MQIQKVHTVYFSATQTTEKVAQAIAKGTGKETTEHNFTKLYKAKPIAPFAETDLVIVGAPVYVGRIPKVILPFLQTLQGNNTPCVLLGVYGNRAFDDYLVELEDMMKAQGFVPVAAVAFLGEHSFTSKLATARPNADDLKVAEQLGKDIIAKLEKQTETTPLTAGAVPGKRLYRKPFVGSGKREPVAPVVNDACVQCGICATVCPMGAIDEKDARKIDAEKCIKCRACARSCPQNAIDFADATFWEHTDVLIENFSDYKEPTIVV